MQQIRMFKMIQFVNKTGHHNEILHCLVILTLCFMCFLIQFISLIFKQKLYLVLSMLLFYIFPKCFSFTNKLCEKLSD